MIKLFGKSQILKKDEKITIYREGTNIPHNVVYVAGKPIKRNGIEFCVKGNVQPLSERELLLVPEADRYKEILALYITNQKIFSEDGLEIQTESILADNDRVTRLGVNYQAQGVKNWGSYTYGRIVRIDVGPNATP